MKGYKVHSTLNVKSRAYVRVLIYFKQKFNMPTVPPRQRTSC